MQVLVSQEAAACQLPSHHNSFPDFTLLWPVCGSQGFISCATPLHKTSSCWENGNSTRCSAASHRDHPPSKSTPTNRLRLLSTASVTQRLHSRQGQSRNLRHRQETPRKSKGRGRKGREGRKDTGTPRVGQHQDLPVQYLLLSSTEPESFKETRFKPTNLRQ